MTPILINIMVAIKPIVPEELPVGAIDGWVGAGERFATLGVGVTIVGLGVGVSVILAVGVGNGSAFVGVGIGVLVGLGETDGSVN